MERKSKIDIINDLLKYNLTNRSVVVNTDPCLPEENCLYNGPDGKHCAFGQYLRSEYQIEEPFFGNNSSLKDVNDTVTSLDELLVDEVHGHIFKFWSDVQAFHDSSGNFTDIGLSEKGAETHQKLLITWELATFEDGKSD